MSGSLLPQSQTPCTPPPPPAWQPTPPRFEKHPRTLLVAVVLLGTQECLDLGLVHGVVDVEVDLLPGPVGHYLVDLRNLGDDVDSSGPELYIYIYILRNVILPTSGGLRNCVTAAPAALETLRNCVTAQDSCFDARV